MIEDAPMEVRSRGRLYTTHSQRDRLGVEEESVYGHGTDVRVRVATVDRSVDWGIYSERVVFSGELGTYGEIRMPTAVREQLSLDVGDSVRVSISTA